jgi:thiol-disulfide isomerase/thioredoxin
MTKKKRDWSPKKIVKELAIGLLLLFVISMLLNTIRQPELTSNRLPGIDVRLVNGDHFIAPKGKVLLIHFWGSWCPICKMEAPNIQSVSEKYEVLSIAVNSGSDEEIKTYMEKHGVRFRVLNDQDGKWAKMFDVEVFPTTFIYDTKGELKFSEVGYTTTAGLLARSALAER